LIIGGSFDTLGLKNIAAYDQTTDSWGPVGTCDSVSGTVLSLEEYLGDLIVGGYFTEICDQPYSHIARWNGTEWLRMGDGLDDNWYETAIEDIHANGNDLYVGGFFWTSGGDTVNHISRWDGSVWRALHRGTNERVTSIATVGKDVYIGGYFSTAGDISADQMALWHPEVNLVRSAAASESLVVSYRTSGIEVLLPQYADDWDIEIFDLLGSRVFTISQLDGGNHTLPRTLSPGAYLLRASSGRVSLKASFVAW
jgi:hypothetical protein